MGGIYGSWRELIDAAVKPVEVEEDQPDLLGFAPLLGEPARAVVTARGPGRPKGAKNRRDVDMVQFILSRHRSPLLGMAEIVDADLETLRASLQCSLLEAAEFQLKAASQLALYLHQRQAQALQINNQTVGALMVVNMNAPKAGAVPVSPFGVDMELQQNQGVSTSADGASHGTPSHEEAKVLK